MFVENRLHHAILTAMNIFVNPRVEMAVRSFTSSSKNRHNSSVQNHDRREITWNTEIIPLRSASSRLDFKTEERKKMRLVKLKFSRMATFQHQDLIMTEMRTFITW